MDVKELGWTLIAERLERGEHATKTEVAALLRSTPLGPSIVSEWIADALEGNLKPGRSRGNAFDHFRKPMTQAVLEYNSIRRNRKRERNNWRGTADEDLEAVAERHGFDPEALRIEVRRARPKRSKK
jgi:hypothetical protein